jgi:hypothetical protein
MGLERQPKPGLQHATFSMRLALFFPVTLVESCDKWQS